MADQCDRMVLFAITAGRYLRQSKNTDLCQSVGPSPDSTISLYCLYRTFIIAGLTSSVGSSSNPTAILVSFLVAYSISCSTIYANPQINSLLCFCYHCTVWQHTPSTLSKCLSSLIALCFFCVSYIAVYTDAIYTANHAYSKNMYVSAHSQLSQLFIAYSTSSSYRACVTV